MYTNDGTGPDEDSTLDLAVNCGECGEPLTLTLETPIGLGGADLKTPTALCSPACVDANVRRVAEAFDRCKCGAAVTALDTLRTTQRRGVIGCVACDYTGRRSPNLGYQGPNHYWARHGAYCQPAGESTKRLNLTIRRQLVDCPACLHALVADRRVQS
jgi:hypothetical protein